jgi:hypothetical protein
LKKWLDNFLPRKWLPSSAEEGLAVVDTELSVRRLRDQPPPGPLLIKEGKMMAVA